MSDHGSEEEKPMLEIAQGESIYDFATFLPALHGKTGAFGWDMKMGFMLMIINFMMQVGLTWIVGQGVLSDSQAWRSELVEMDLNDQMAVIDKEDTVLKQTLAMFQNLESIGKSLFYAQEPKSWQTDDNTAELIHNMNMYGQDSFLQQGNMHRSNKFTRKPKGGKGGAAAAAGGDDGGGGGAIGARTLCVMSKKNASYSCLPPSVRFSQYWKDLDTNGDGVWTMEEAQKDEGQLEKKINVKPPQLMRAVVMGLVDRPDDALWVPDSMKALDEVPKPYFDYWAGDAAICAYGDVSLCSSLVGRGVFNKALDPAIPGKGIKNLNTAMDYCNFMLKPGGGCDQSLPQIYRLYKTRRAEQCGKVKFYPGGIYKNEYNTGDKMYVIGVSYSALNAFVKSETILFKVFMFLILLIWFFALLNEARELFKLWEFCAKFPAVEDAKEGMEDADEEGNLKTITGITAFHRRYIMVVTLLRTCLVLYIINVGAVFLINDTGYMDLLMNAVALAFIIEIDELLFGAMARADVCDAFENLDGLEFETGLPTEGCAGWMLMKDFWGLVLAPIAAICIITYHSHFTVDAVLDALRCACYQEGDQCADASYFDQAFWDGYWTNVLPSALEKIAALKSGAR